MSKNKYLLPFKGKYFVEYGGLSKKTSHSWNIISQRYAYDFEIRENNLPYYGDYQKLENYYCYLDDVICPCSGFVIDLQDDIENTKVYKDRPVVNDGVDVRGNYISIKHPYGEYSTICHLEAGSINIAVGDLVEAGQVLGNVGNSGNTQGPHIHFQVQNGPDFEYSEGIIVTFKNAYIGSKKKRFIAKNHYVSTEKEG